MIIIDQITSGGGIQAAKLNCRPVQRTNRTTTDLIDRTKDIYLVYFRSDMTGRVVYAYTQDITDFGNKRSNYQYSDLKINQVDNVTAEDVYAGRVCFEPAGFWYYIIYEVHFADGTLVDGFNVVSKGYAPYNNLGDYAEPEGPQPAVSKGVLGLAVEEGKLYIQADGITYKEHTQNNDNYIYTE